MLDSNKIPYANWAVDDAPEASAALKPGTAATSVGSDSVLTASGKFIKAKLKSMNLGVSCSSGQVTEAPEFCASVYVEVKSRFRKLKIAIRAHVYYND